MMHGSRGHNILLVDDEEVFLSSLFEGLRRRFPEMTFRTAHDGEAALTELHEHPVDLVITDLKMPKMDGFQLIAAMHSQYPAIPLLIMTAHSTELSEGRAMASGALHCIDKPVDLAELSRRIDELFSTGAIASLRGVSLAAFLQLLGLEKKSGIVDVQSEGVRARLYLSGGQIIHADNGNLSGLPAALRTVSLENVEIHFRPGAVPKTPTIDLPLTQILLDAARQSDEGVRDATKEFDDLAFSESFSDAFDEQLSKLESVPVVPDVPDAPDVSDVPDAPDVPDVPDAPDVRDAPDISDAPDVTDASDAPALPPPPAAAAAPIERRPPRVEASQDARPLVPAAPRHSGRLESGINVTAALRDLDAAAARDVAGQSARTNRHSSPTLPMRTSETSGPVISGIIHSPAMIPGSAPVAAPAAAPVAAPAAAPVAAPVAAPAAPSPARPSSTALPIPRLAHQLGPMSAAARAAVLTPPNGRPALPRPPSMRPRSPTPPLHAYSAEANASDAVASCLRKIGEIGGVLGAAFVDFHSGETLGSVTCEAGFDTAANARANIELVRAKLAMIARLGLADTIDDIVITSHRQYHVLRMSERRPRQFVFVALAREHATLALARFLIDEALQGASAGAAAS